MSRAFTPPDTLSKDDIKAIADVRREIWSNGFKGMAGGAVVGYALHGTVKSIQARIMKNTGTTTNTKIAPLFEHLKLNGNTAFLSVMLGASLGAFILSSTAGKNSVHKMHHVFEVGKVDTSTPYQKSINDAKLEEEHRERKERVLNRRKTLHDNLIHGHGLTDSHGGNWTYEGSDKS